MSKTEIPSIRFHGFDDAWEQRKLSELIIEYKKQWVQIVHYLY